MRATLFQILKKIFLFLLLSINCMPIIQSEEAPSFADDIANGTITETLYYEGNPLLLNCSATGDPMPNITWTAYNNDYTQFPIDCDDDNGVHCDNWTLEIWNTTDIANVYQCKVCNMLGCISQFNKIEHVMFMVLSHNPVIEVTQNDNDFLHCTTSYYDDKVMSADGHIIWFKHNQRNLTKAESEKLIEQMEDGKDAIDNQFFREKMKNLYDIYGVREIKQHEFGNSVLTLRNLTASDEGWYTCFIILENDLYNKAESVYVKVVSNTKAEKSINQNNFLRNFDLLENDYFILSCRISKEYSNITWYHDGNKIRCDYDERRLCIGELLIMENVKLDDAGSYRCCSSSSSNCYQDFQVKISKKVKLLTSIKLENQTAEINKSTRLQCKLSKQEIAHESVVEYVWMKFEDKQKAAIILNRKLLNKILFNNPKYSDIFKFSDLLSAYDIELVKNEQNFLQLSNISLLDEAWYACIATTSKAQGFSTAYLTVIHPPQFQFTSTTTVLYQYDDLTLRCGVTANPKAKLKWYHDNKELECFQNKKIICTESELIMTQLTKESTGIYKCIAGNSLGSIEHNTFVIVLPKASCLSLQEEPVFITPPGPINGLLGQNLTIECIKKQKNFNAQLRWIKIMLNEEDTHTALLIKKIMLGIPAADDNSESDDKIYERFFKILKKHEVHTNSIDEIYKTQLNLTNLAFQDQALYVCLLFKKAWNNELLYFGTGKTYLRVLDESSPIFGNNSNLNEHSITIEEGKTLILNCNATAKPTPRIFWYRNDSRIQCHEKRVTCKNFNLELRDTTLNDSAPYECELCNEHGCIIKKINVKIQNKSSNLLTLIAIATTLLFLIITLITILSYLIIKRYKNNLEPQREPVVHRWTKIVLVRWPEEYVPENECESITPIIEIQQQKQIPAKSADEEYLYEHDARWELIRSNIALGEKLGEGSFGRVIMGHTTDLITSNGTPIELVAVKMLKENPSENEVKNLVHEMEIMKSLGKHVNIVNFLGCCSQNGPLWVVVEFAEYGNLKKFLQKHQQPIVPQDGYINCNGFDINRFELTEQHLISFAYQIARGMDFLNSKKCIHRDLAARNILVSSNFIMKIADFGLARALQLSEYYRKDQNNLLPVKWMAPEALEEQKFTSYTDIWSFGVLLWEIMSYGGHPYEGISTIIQLLTLLQCGERLSQPNNCPDHIYRIMLDCWNIKANARPSFQQLSCKLDSLLENSAGDGYLNMCAI